ncbi:MAG: magnesium transporter [Planctomycetes bacterium]|nr:magnesium transporter [Planctomycetota bacterium]MCB9910636.1 magnesium transporter [Planctomycetota bacterium]
MQPSHWEPGIDPIVAALADIEAGRFEELRIALAGLPASEVARVLEAMPPEQRTALWEVVPVEQEADVLSELNEEVRGGIFEEMDHAELVAATGQMDVEDLADVIEELPEEVSSALIDALEADHRRRLEAVLAYDEETAGRLMSTDVLSVRPGASLGVVLRWLRRHSELPPYTDALMVIDNEGRYLGKLSLERIVTGDPDALVEAVMEPAAETVRADADESDVAALFQRRQLISVAVVDDQNRLLGRITVDEMVDLIRDEADNALLKSAGLSEDADLFAPILPSARRRAIWLGINLITVFLAAGVIGRFQAEIDKMVALAVLLPVVASMGGIAGSQTLTLTIRGMALGQIVRGNIRWLTIKELAVGALNGVVWAVVVAVATWLWFRDVGLSIVIGCALVLNLVAASLSGVIVPLTLKRMGIDPALSGAVILTTVTDVIGFLSFLGLASWFLLP